METYGKENINTPSSSDRNEALVTSPTCSKPVPVRPLTAAYQAARSDHQVISNNLLTRSASDFSLKYWYIVKQKGDENKENDQ